MRKVHIDGNVWQYKVGKSIILIVGPNNERHLVGRERVGIKRVVWSWFDMDYKEKIEVKPSHVKEYIQRKFGV